MLGVRPVLGREFAEKDDQDKGAEVLMLSYGYWQRRFGGGPKVIGRRIMADGLACEIIGGFRKLSGSWTWATILLMPLRFDRSTVRLAGYNFQRSLGCGPE